MAALNGPLRWGFFGAGKITQDFVTILKSLPSHKHIPVGIAARDALRAKSFADSHGIQKSFGSYQQLAEDPEIDIVYIGTVNSEHYPQAKIALEHSKHVLIEKPICINYRQCQDLVDSAKEKGVFLMEGFWTAFFPATKRLMSEVENGSIGDIVAITLEVGWDSWQKERFRSLELGGGILLNYGVYGVMLTYLLLGYPDVIKATGHLSSDGVDETMTLTMSYKDKACVSNVIMSSRAAFPCEFRVIGKKGIAKLPCPFWAPAKCETPNGTTTHELPPPWNTMNNTTFNYISAPGFIYEIDEVHSCISQGRSASTFVPWDASLAVMKIADEARKQLGVIFPQEKS